MDKYLNYFWGNFEKFGLIFISISGHTARIGPRRTKYSTDLIPSRLLTSFQLIDRVLLGEQFCLRLLDHISGDVFATVLPLGRIKAEDVVGGERRRDVVVAMVSRDVGWLWPTVDPLGHVGAGQDDDPLLAVVAGARVIVSTVDHHCRRVEGTEVERFQLL